MFLAWRSASLRDLCEKRGGIDTAWPANAQCARELISLVAHAHDLASLMRLRSVSTKLTQRAGRLVITIGLEEVDMLAAPLTRVGRLIEPEPAAQDLTAIAGTTDLLVEDLTANGHSIERAI